VGSVVQVQDQKMSNLLHGKHAMVTGGSSGIGVAIARHFVSEGASVLITGRRRAELDAAVAAVGTSISGVQADSSVLADLDRVYETARKQSGKVDIVVANAGILEKAPLGEIIAKEQRTCALRSHFLDLRRRRGPPFSQSIAACHMTKAAQIAALPAIRSAWKPLQEFLRSVTVRPFGTTKPIEPHIELRRCRRGRPPAN
jgi:NAD(P)-dependent dehydrogenase (short-subunit alcohol dehydrogenase family)